MRTKLIQPRTRGQAETQHIAVNPEAGARKSETHLQRQAIQAGGRTQVENETKTQVVGRQKRENKRGSTQAVQVAEWRQKPGRQAETAGENVQADPGMQQ